MKPNAKTVADVRAQTGAGLYACTRALEQTGGDVPKAVELLNVQPLPPQLQRQKRVGYWLLALSLLMLVISAALLLWD